MRVIATAAMLGVALAALCGFGGALAAVGGKKPLPVVMDSSMTIASSGIASAIACAIEA